MDELKLDRAFVQIVESRNMSAAARHMNTSVTSIARQLSRLEATLGVRLLNRTTRSQSLTEAGQLYYSRLVEVLQQVDDIKREVSSYQEGVKGRLRVHLRTSFGAHVIVPALPRFLARYPEISLEVALTDERADLVAQGVDVAVWLGNLEDSSLIARRLNPSKRVLCASPAYLAAHGTPQAPEDLADHNCLVFLAKNYGSRWRFTQGEQMVEIPVTGNLQTGHGTVLLASALEGLGLVILQEAIVREDLKRGGLVQVLPEYEVSPTESDTALYAVFPTSRRISPKTRAFVDFLADLFRRQD